MPYLQTNASARPAPISFTLGQGDVIRGWDFAASTMSTGERCILTVGPAYGYGSSDSGPIPANSTLTFEMQMMGFEKPPLVSMDQWVGAVFVLAIICFLLFVPDGREGIREQIAQENTQEL